SPSRPRLPASWTTVTTSQLDSPSGSSPQSGTAPMSSTSMSRCSHVRSVPAKARGRASAQTASTPRARTVAAGAGGGAARPGRLGLAPRVARAAHADLDVVARIDVGAVVPHPRLPGGRARLPAPVRAVLGVVAVAVGVEADDADRARRGGGEPLDHGVA